METNLSNSKLSLAEKLHNGLKKAQQEIEELTLQFALGKAEASDKFEDIKKDKNHPYANKHEANDSC